MIDPILSLTFAIQSNPGVYALLLGSGISRAAKIPTGWEVTLDLVRKMAALIGENCEPSPEQWYREKFDRAPDYSEVLAAVAKMPAERQQLLRSYWEPSDQEREDSLKQPTAAHRAIANLVEQGYIRIIITTNFDRLIETALADVGITPTVLSSPDHIKGALPLIHTRCCVIKLHGDYLDTRILNTPEELSSYPRVLEKLLDRIFDEFGLVICGWSAEWDEALRKAMFRAPARRFSTYWAVIGEPTPSARQLIDHRAAEVISITGADALFPTLQQQVQSLQEFSRPHPLSTEAAVVTLKRYLSEDRHRIQLHDLVSKEVANVATAIEKQNFWVGDPKPDSSTTTSRVRTYEAICSTLVAMAAVQGQWIEQQHYSMWQRALERVVVTNTVYNVTVYDFWSGIRKYPGTLLLYALGIGALEWHRLQFLGELFSTPMHQEHNEDVPAVCLLAPVSLFENGSKIGQILEGKTNHRVPINQWLNEYFRNQFRQLLPGDNRYSLIFDEFEVLLGLSSGYHDKNKSFRGYWAPWGCFNYNGKNRASIYKKIEESITSLQENSPYVTSKIFGNSVDICLEELRQFKAFMDEIRLY